MEHDFDVTKLLAYIDPARLSYQDWLNVGMALHHEGCDLTAWADWSRQDPGRFHPGECEKKWAGFRGSAAPVTGATITQLAKEGGWRPGRREPQEEGRALDWDEEISWSDLRVVDRNWVEGKELPPPPADWNGAADLVKYLETLFDSTDLVGYVTESWERDGKFFPSKGHWNYTAGEIIDQLNKHGGDLGAVLGDYNPQVGAWIRFNPLDGQGCMNENVRGFRFALVESDHTDLADQYAILQELELPIACLVHSGGKSLHAIVRVDADTYEEYRKRVDYLYTVCQKNGLAVDKNNRNPSRLSRMPGVLRQGKPQYLIGTNLGKASWSEWKEWVESVNDDLPDPESMAEVWDNLPPLAPPLIDGVLRQGHKLLLAGPSKAGKSYALIQLCCSLAEGRPWMGFPCAQGKVLYVNLELDRASCLHRFRDVYEALGWQAKSLGNIDIWNLRGRSIPMDKLAPKLIRRALKKNYLAVVIDPIYKVITGDENSADQMANFCNQFDKVCTELGCAVIYCHHHSKGAQGAKRSMDRASGSGVFARDPDALLDLIELEVSEDLRGQQESDLVCQICRQTLAKAGLLDRLEEGDRYNERALLAACEGLLGDQFVPDFRRVVEARKAVQSFTAWRIEGTLREFPKFVPVNLWFQYPVHRVDESGVLGDIDPEEQAPSWKKNFKKKRTPEERKKERREELELAFEACRVDGEVTLFGLSQCLGVGEKATRNRVKEHGGFWVDEGVVGRKQ